MARASWRCDQLSAEEHAAVAPLRHLLGDGAAILGHAGLNQGFGHLSVRVPGRDLLLITPRKNFTAIAPDEIEVVDFAGRKLTANSAERAPNELFIHICVYETRPDVLAVARTQAEYVEAFGVAGVPIRPVHDFGAILMGHTPVHPEPRLVTIRERGEAMVRALGNRASLMLRGNGCVVVGRSIQEAVVRAIFLEESARLQYRALVIRQARHGDGAIAVFDDAEIAEIGTDLGRADRIDRKWRSLLVEAGRTPSALPAALPPADVASAGGGVDGPPRGSG
jgi:ribulose-5-phosphate 4-epimerase/fuculose-1-phosphate aldolase